ncbi:MAG: response regulator [Anaerolineae bacterium]|nr:response regulator [Anaerolineae bacterium]
MGKIRAFSTAGGHRRIHAEDFSDFLQNYGMPAWDEERPSSKPRVLIVDDEPDIIALIANALERTGAYELATAGDGFEAGLQVVEFQPDLMVLDLMMPGLDGFKVCQRIKSDPNTRHVKVLVVTGFAQEENIARALACGAELCMAKPFSPMALVKKIGEFLKDKYPSLVSVAGVS